MMDLNFNASDGYHDNYTTSPLSLSPSPSLSLSPSFAGNDSAIRCTLFIVTDDDDRQRQQWKCDAILNARRISALLSLIGCFVIISTIWLFRKYQLFSQRLLMYLSISGAVSSLAYWMGDSYQDGPTCNFEAFLLTFGEWSVLLWTSLIVWNVCVNVMLSRRNNNTSNNYPQKPNEWMYHVIGWAFPFAISTSPLFGDHYGPSGAWCWIQPDNWNWRVAIWNVPSSVLITLQTVSIVVVAVVVRKQTILWEGPYSLELERSTVTVKECVKPLLPYPLVYLMTSVVPLIKRIQDTIEPNNSAIFTIDVLQNFLCPLSGALNAIVFISDKETRSKLTWPQIKAAWQRNTNQQQVIREYPIMYRMEDKVCNGENRVVQFLRYDRVEYQKLQGKACNGQSCLEAEIE